MIQSGIKSSKKTIPFKLLQLRVFFENNDKRMTATPSKPHPSTPAKINGTVYDNVQLQTLHDTYPVV